KAGPACVSGVAARRRAAAATRRRSRQPRRASHHGVARRTDRGQYGVVTNDHKSSRVIGYLCALGAGSVWGTTGPLSTKLYADGAAITGIGFWRLPLGPAGLAPWAALSPRAVCQP